ncbi:MAG: hypothetical protein U1E70_07710 [Acetobacteraceae bacterium]
MRARAAFRRLALPAALLALSGCGPGRNEFAPACPVAQLVPALADLTRFTGNGRDLTDLVVQARIIQVRGECSPGSNDTLNANVAISISVQRGPAMAGRDVDVPVFVAVSRGGDVLDKQSLPVTVSFPPNVDRVALTSQPITLALPVGDGIAGPSYHVIAGFQLTPDEVEFNRRGRGR